MENSRKKKKRIQDSLGRQLLFFGISMLCIICFYQVSNKRLNQLYVLKEDDFSLIYQIDSIEEVEGNLKICGWAFALNKEAELGSYELILYDMKAEKAYYPKMSYKKREDVNQYFFCEYDYTDSGFTATIPTKKLSLDDSVYQICIKQTGKKNTIATNVFYANGAMQFANPDEFVPLEVAGTDLETIVENGVLRVYRPDYGMYVYQYQGELYWIAEPWYGFVEENTYVQFQMNTTQIENLPAHRLENGHFWSNLGFWFQSNECLEWNTGKYRVTKKALPTEYSVTKIWTGNYIGDWIWKTDFRPWYDLE